MSNSDLMDGTIKLSLHDYQDLFYAAKVNLAKLRETDLNFMLNLKDYRTNRLGIFQNGLSIIRKTVFILILKTSLSEWITNLENQKQSDCRLMKNFLFIYPPNRDSVKY